MAKPRTRRTVLALAVIAAIAGVFFVWPIVRGREGPPPPPDCQLGPTVAGIDVSYYQQEITWSRVRKAGIRYAFIRHSDGATIVDARFARNWRDAKRVGVLRGAYQYFRPNESALAQADLLANALGRDPGELPPVIDVEDHGGLGAAQLEAAVRAWVDRVRTRLGVEPIVYTGPEFWRDRARNADLTRQPLWIAHYTRGCPTVPAPWTAWTLWQHTDNGRVPGIDGPVDLDLFAGTPADLEDFARRSRLR